MSDTQASTPISPTTKFADLPEWLSPKEVADYLRRSPWTVYQGIDKGLIPHQAHSAESYC